MSKLAEIEKKIASMEDTDVIEDLTQFVPNQTDYDIIKAYLIQSRELDAAHYLRHSATMKWNKIEDIVYVIRLMQRVEELPHGKMFDYLDHPDNWYK